MVPPALIGLLAGLFVRNVPLLKRTMGQPVLGVKQHRPRIAYIAGYALLVVTLVLTPIFCGVMFGDLGACFIIMFVLGGPLVIPFVNHCHAFYIQQTVSGFTGVIGGGRFGICRMRVSAKSCCKVMGRTGT